MYLKFAEKVFLIHIREEALDRPTGNFRSHEEALYARDEVAGGAALAVGNLRLACLNNFHESSDEGGPLTSRGVLAVEFVTSGHVPEVSDRKFLPFRLFCLRVGETPEILAHPGTCEKIESDVFVLGNKKIPEARVIAAEIFFRSSAEVWSKIGNFLDDEKFLVSPRYSEILKATAASRSQTVVEISDHKISVQYRTILWEGNVLKFSEWTRVPS